MWYSDNKHTVPFGCLFFADSGFIYHLMCVVTGESVSFMAAADTGIESYVTNRLL